MRLRCGGYLGLVQALTWAGLLLAVGGARAGAAAPAPTETIVLLRHAEKPALGLGQLTCQGLNRALALPAVIARDFGRPAAIFAPNPAIMKKDGGQAYSYIRPLATVEPTAIALGMTVDVSHGVQDWQDLGRALEAPRYAGAVVIVAWEHSDIVKLARWLMSTHRGDAAKVPDWDRADFDRIYVLRLRDGQASFVQRREGLNGQPMNCTR